MFPRIVAGLIAVTAALLAGGCASNPTSIDAQWVSPSIASAPRMQNVLVIAALRAAVARVGASHVLISSVSGMTTDVRVTPGMVTGPGWGPGWSRSSAMGPGWRGMSSYYSAAWARSTPPEVRTTQNLHGDTRLFDVASSEVVWSTATTTVTSRSNLSARIDGFVRLIVDTLRQDSLI